MLILQRDNRTNKTISDVVGSNMTASVFRSLIRWSFTGIAEYSIGIYPAACSLGIAISEKESLGLPFANN